jgi:integrase/recombinase XerD
MISVKATSLVEEAIFSIPRFSRVMDKVTQRAVLFNHSKSAISNYLRQIARVCLHFGKLPEDISDEEINMFLMELALSTQSPSRSSFKHAVYGLRYYYRSIGLDYKAVELPSLRKEFKLPIVLNRSELRELFRAPSSLKHRVILTLTYSAGLRCREVINLKLSDIDFERKIIHIQQSKNRKDRIVPLSNYIIKGLHKYIETDKPVSWLFNGVMPKSQYSPRGLSWILRCAVSNTSIQKRITLHTLRHTYATHLLEDGVNILSIKNLLGHSSIASTMVYLHIADCPIVKVHSPFDSLYNWEKPNETRYSFESANFPVAETHKVEYGIEANG